ncbi:hypothetical protein FQN50_006180 [Emmonsiellopsis sp. PD_5]|nr:hypothetical protein FQN50_006180 [Emmonsiellopsis sp. PD_5]
MHEDEIYRTSSQYRLWSFTATSLQSIRANTNAVAAERVRAAIRRAKQQARGQQTATPEGGTPNAGEDGKENAVGNGNGNGDEIIECLTPEEELELVRYYCEKTMELGDAYQPALSTAVRTTAIQYLRRFYLTNSPMTYHPKSIMPCALFLATKTENYYMSLRSFAEHIPNSTPEDIIAPEFLLTQGLRFTFDVRHPFRSLEGGIMELNAIARGEGAPGPHHVDEQTSEGLRERILALSPNPNQTKPTGGSITSRIGIAHDNTRQILRSAAQLTDVYFLYTPSQIWLAALLLADRPLAEFYLDTKLGPVIPTSTSSSSSSSPASQALTSLRNKLTTTLTACADTLSTYQKTHTDATAPATMKNLKRIGKKLYHCQNPEKMDLIGLNRAAKREGNGCGSGSGTPMGMAGVGVGATDDAELQRAAKKRKLERERAEREGERIFGGELGRPRGGVALFHFQHL